MISIGSLSLSVALVLAIYSLAAFILAARNNNQSVTVSAQRAVYCIFVLVTISCAVLLYALFTRNFNVEYVAQYSNRSLSWFYTTAAFWAGQAGSLLLWAWLLALFAVLVIIQNRKSQPVLLPFVMSVMSVALFFFLYLLVFKTNPFIKLSFIPTDGRGLNPLLQNPEMIFHPPSLYIGFVGFTVPFAFALAAMMTKQLDNLWVKSIRRWSLFSWLFLTIGNILGMQWAYVELGWGGYWAWDPVENSSLLPWLSSTAFIHTVIAQERKGVLKKWNLSLIILTFALTIFGTFVTRSGLISSVHAFGVSDLGPLFLGFLALILVVSFTLLYRRSPLLNSSSTITGWTSRESSFLLNNLLFVAITIGVFLGTIMPSLSEAFTNKKITVGAEFFDRLAVPIGLAIALLIGICTLLSWNATSVTRIIKNFIIPAGITVLVLVMHLVGGTRHFMALLATSIIVFSSSSTILEFVRGIRVRQRMEKSSFFPALIYLLRTHKRRYGAFIVHLGVLLFILGIAGSSVFSYDTTVTVDPGQKIITGDYELKYRGITGSHDKNYHIDTAQFDIYRNGKKIGVIQSEKHLHPNFQPATEVGIRTRLKEDLYVILADYDAETGRATISVLVNALVLWMWIGGVLMVIGAIMALLPAGGKRLV